MAARAYRDRMHSIIIIDTERLLEEYADKVSLARINTGSTIMSVPTRGVGTFQSISDYPFDYWRKKRGPQRAVAELAVDYQVSDVSDLVVRVEHWKVDRLIEVVWTP